VAVAATSVGITVAVVLGVRVGVEFDATRQASIARSGFPRNAAGETYGSVLGISQTDAPDLILVECDSGVVGYVRKSELRTVDGSDISDPLTAARKRQSALILTVYAQDGRTVVGVWRMGG
jgi:hypothetical protein